MANTQSPGLQDRFPPAGPRRERCGPDWQRRRGQTHQAAGAGKKEHGRKKPKYSVNPLGTQNKDISEFIIVRTVHQVRRKAPPLSEASNKCI